MPDTTSAPPSPVQCSTGPFWAYELEKALDVLAEAGFTDIEIMVTRDRKTQEPELLRRLAEERSLRVATVHGPFLALTKSVWGLDPLDKIRRSVDMCRIVGARTLIVHPPYLWEREYGQWLSYRSEAYSAETGVTVAVETMYPRWVAGRRLRAHRWLDPRELAESVPYIVMDTSHLTVARHDILTALGILAPKLVHVHLSNNAGDGRDGHLELEKGSLPLERFLTDLRRMSYSGAVCLELSVGKYLERTGHLVQMLTRSREYVEAKLSQDVRRLAKGLPRR
jgi:sugar phosphate isomerase/epimerase